MDRHNEPWPIRRKGETFEVVMIEGDAVVGYIRCDSREDAEAVADAGPLNNVAMASGHCEGTRALRCLNALRRHGLDERTLLGRRVRSLC